MSRSISRITPADLLGTGGLWHGWASVVLARFPKFAQQDCSYLREQRGNLSAITFHRNSRCLSLPWWFSCTALSFKNVIFICTVFWGKHAPSFIHSALAERPACTRRRGLDHSVSLLSQTGERRVRAPLKSLRRSLSQGERPVTCSRGGGCPERRGFPGVGFQRRGGWKQGLDPCLL